MESPNDLAIPRFRWTICALLFFATSINYIDRQVFSLLAPDLQRSIGWTELEYGKIIAAFQAAYAIGLVVSGRIMDRLGTRRGYSYAISCWSLAGMAHALAHSAFGFGIARFALGLGEAGNFPAALKTVAEWFPQRERALATGIFNAGSNVGAVAAPLLVPWITINWGWRSAFLITGSLGVIWLIFWLLVYQKPEHHPRLSARELAYIQQDGVESTAPVKWLHLIAFRQTWAFAIAKFLTDPVWWFYLFWLPKFLNQRFGLTLDKIGWPLVVVYLAADIGSVLGGWLSSYLIQHGHSVNFSRKTAMLICALAVVPIMLLPWVSGVWQAVALLGLATAGHQGWSANLYTLVSDMFPRRAVGSTVGLGSALGAVGGALASAAAGQVLQITGSYFSLFLTAGTMYVLALGIIQILSPRMELARLSNAPELV